MKKIPACRVFLSAPLDNHLTDGQLRIKTELVRRIEERGFEPQEFLRRGVVARKSWTFQNAIELAAGCQGMLVLGLARSRWEVKEGVYLCPSEYSHFEGALGLSRRIPTMIIAQRGVIDRGIVSTAGGEAIAYVDPSATASPLGDQTFRMAFDGWLDEIASRPRVFLGYCGNARHTANDIQQYVERDLDVRMVNYAMDFMAGGTILDEIERAARECTCGIFLFTNDDPLVSPVESIAAPRDNVVFEAGYFMHAKGKSRTLIIREEGAKMPADVGGNIYVLLKDRNDISTIHRALQKFLIESL